MDVRRTTPFSASITAALQGSGVENDIVRWLNELEKKHGVESLSFFLDETSTKAISGRFFFDINPGLSAKGKEKVGSVEIHIDSALAKKIGEAIHQNPGKATEVLFAVAEYMADNPDIRRICDDFHNKEFARQNADREFGKNKGADSALYNFIVAQAAYKILEAAIKDYLKTMPKEVTKNMERIYEIKKEIPRVERRLTSDPDYQGKAAQKQLTAELAAYQKELGDLMSDPRNTFDTVRILDELRKLVNQNKYNHEQVRNAVVSAPRVNAAAWDTDAPQQRSGSTPTTKGEKVEAGKRAPLEGKPAPTKLAVEEESKAKRSHSTGGVFSKLKINREEAKAAKEMEKMRKESEARVKAQLEAQEKEKQFKANPTFEQAAPTNKGEMPAPESPRKGSK